MKSIHIIKEFVKNMNSGEGLKKREPSLHCQWDCKLVQLLWRTVWKSLLLYMCVQLLSHVRLCDPMDCTCQASLSFSVPRKLLKFMSIELVMLSNCHIICHPLFLLFAFNLFRLQSLFQAVSSLHQVAKELELQH